ncbi:efflux RND transporter periplasmic adaptor subunit [Novosphingobium piscinae]|uniref:HlyD family efflux transporter periplasmic adaptor subunit n=1 Tax=Novosphingobium piscinae TaxID=1507448 RepID=A0A7X1KQX5_9SPHN|nr:HlyD family efflux transporter periplasmic adaptor subunit [Novosphingobium piscinae]MBC2670184.1 HlyD family efflux transporter periplasmic adaptor subunit [Novosphingobium piscinae]
MSARPDHMRRFATLAALEPPRLARVLSTMILFGAAVVVVILFAVPWVQTTSGYGTVVALHPEDRVQSVTALVPGRVERWFVRDGETVRKGDPIAQVVDNDPGLLARLAAERAQVEAEIEAAQQAMAVAQIDVGRSRQLLSEGLVARREYEASMIKVADHRAKLAESRAKLNRVDVALTRQSAQIVRAPRDGRIQSINAAAGATLVSAGDVLATLAPSEPVRVIELLIDGRDIALVHSGRSVRIEFEGWPAIQFSGWPSVAYGMFDARVRSVDPSARTDGLFRVLVEPAPGARPWPAAEQIRLGAKVRGWVRLDTVTVGYELWRQLNNFPPEFGSIRQAAEAADSKGNGAKAKAKPAEGDSGKDGGK